MPARKVDHFREVPTVGVPVTAGELLADLATPGVELVIIGESHFTLRHMENEVKIINALAGTGRPFRLVLENYSENMAGMFEDAWKGGVGGQDALRDAVFGLKTGDLFEPKWAIIEAALSRGMEAVPVNPPLASHCGEEEREKHFTRILNMTAGRMLTIGIFGSAHAESDFMLSHLAVARDRRREVINNGKMPEGIIRDGRVPQRYFVNADL